MEETSNGEKLKDGLLTLAFLTYYLDRILLGSFPLLALTVAYLPEAKK
ncbi:hypothetical protein [Thermococcus piezophilus]|nr:hypothetical protein [Thermococcus piezophilus]